MTWIQDIPHPRWFVPYIWPKLWNCQSRRPNKACRRSQLPTLKMFKCTWPLPSIKEVQINEELSFPCHLCCHITGETSARDTHMNRKQRIFYAPDAYISVLQLQRWNLDWVALLVAGPLRCKSTTDDDTELWRNTVSTSSILSLETALLLLIHTSLGTVSTSSVWTYRQIQKVLFT